MSYVSTGFTPEEERELLDTQRQMRSSAERLTAWTERQDTIRNITIISIVGGLIFTMARMGELVAQIRARRRESK